MNEPNINFYVMITRVGFELDPLSQYHPFKTYETVDSDYSYSYSDTYLFLYKQR